MEAELGAKDGARIDLSHRYDQSKFTGRFLHFLDVTDPTTLLKSAAQVHEAVELLKKYEHAPPLASDTVLVNQLWKAKKLRDSAVHPDTGELVVKPLRMSAFMPANVLICLGLLIPNPSMGSIVFWQWVNQTYNIAVNHANRNASNPMSNRQVGEAYVGAMAVSLTVALGLSKAVDRMIASSGGSAFLRSLKVMTPYTAVATASAANVFLMRRNELTSGIEVKDQHGRVVGKSMVAGKTAVSQVAFSRCVIAFPCLTIPPLLMSTVFERMSVVQRNPMLKVPINLAIITGCLFTALPAAIAVFPQNMRFEPSKLEEEFHHLTDAVTGEPITALYCNRGL